MFRSYRGCVEYLQGVGMKMGMGGEGRVSQNSCLPAAFIEKRIHIFYSIFAHRIKGGGGRERDTLCGVCVRERAGM